ncbi:MAG: CPBP family intramembrane metalloprotease [Armatimonadetes bacterium]|nr:CPBP family intramembrane metalloprotease [Armatimonadota bacterium]
MSEPPAKTGPAPGTFRDYLIASRGPWYGFLFALPVLLAYEVLELLYRHSGGGVNLADYLLTRFLTALGPNVRSQALLVILIVSGIFCWRADAVRRGEGRRMQWSYFAGMLLESGLYALLFGIVVIRIMQMLFGNLELQRNLGDGGYLFKMTMSLGAGIYEELLFRVLLMGLLMLLLVGVGKRGRVFSWTIAVLFSSVAFSAFHYIGNGAHPFAIDSFLYRCIAGALFAVIFACRGFGIVVWTHALYDVVVMLTVSDALTR